MTILSGIVRPGPVTLDRLPIADRVRLILILKMDDDLSDSMTKYRIGICV